MNFLKKLTGLFVFAAAVAGAVALSRYFSAPRPVEVPPEPPRVSTIPDDPRLIPFGPPAAEPVAFRARLVTLDFGTKKSHVTLELERDRTRPAPEKLWAWVAFFPAAGGEAVRCEAGPVELRRPFAAGDRPTVVLEADASRCPAPRPLAATIYARVNVSALSAEAARLDDPRLSEDIAKATPVVVAGARR